MKSADKPSLDQARLASAVAAGLCFSLMFILATYAFKKMAMDEEFNFAPLLFALAIGIPVAIFGIAYWQIQLRHKAQSALEQACARITMEETLASKNPRARSSPLAVGTHSTPPTDPVQGLNL